MLILTRKLGERVNIGDDIIVSLLEIKGSQVKLGIEAPKHVSVHRHEIYEKIRAENLSSAEVQVNDLATAIAFFRNSKSKGKEN